jgi:hypothetical protein
VNEKDGLGMDVGWLDGMVRNRTEIVHFNCLGVRKVNVQIIRESLNTDNQLWNQHFTTPSTESQLLSLSLQQYIPIRASYHSYIYWKKVVGLVAEYRDRTCLVGALSTLWGRGNLILELWYCMVLSFLQSFAATVAVRMIWMDWARLR